MSDKIEAVIRFLYVNYRGEKAVRNVVPMSLYFGSTRWHPKEQWLLRAYDVDRGAVRDFALSDCNFKDG